MLSQLPNALSSVLKQTSEDFEWLILDDGSSDGTWQYLQPLAHKPFIRLFRNPEKLGISKSRNRILKACEGQYISILDADDSFLPNKVEHHAQLLDKHPEAGVVWGRSLLIKDRTFQIFPSLDYTQGWDLVSPYRVIHTATTWRKSTLLKAGGYNELLRAGEAVDMFLKVGDFSDQLFDPQLVTIKRLATRTTIRRYFKIYGKKVSRSLLADTLKRRYGYEAKFE